MEEPADPVEVLDEQRLVDAKGVIQGRHRTWVGERTEDPASHVSGESVGRQEDDHGEQPQRDQRQRYAPEQEAQQLRSLDLGGKARLAEVEVAHS